MGQAKLRYAGDAACSPIEKAASWSDIFQYSIFK